VEARLAASHRRDHLRLGPRPAGRGALEPAPGARTARLGARALACVPRVRRVCALADGEPGAVGAPPAPARLRGAASRDLRRGARGGARPRRGDRTLRLLGGRRTRAVAAGTSGEPGHGARAESERARVRALAPDAARVP